MKKELIGSTKEERDLVRASALWVLLLIAFTYCFSCGQRYVNAIKSQKQTTTSVDGQGVK